MKKELLIPILILALTMEFFLNLPDLHGISAPEPSAPTYFGINFIFGYTHGTNAIFEKADFLPNLQNNIYYNGFGMNIFLDKPFFIKLRYWENFRLSLGFNIYSGHNDGFITDRKYYEKVLEGELVNDDLLKYEIDNSIYDFQLGFKYLNNFWDDFIIVDSRLKLTSFSHQN